LAKRSENAAFFRSRQKIEKQEPPSD
jgi:hypothetical protein